MTLFRDSEMVTMVLLNKLVPPAATSHPSTRTVLLFGSDELEEHSASRAMYRPAHRPDIRGMSREEFDTLYRQHHVPLCRVARRIVCAADQAEEVVHDVFTRVWEHRMEWQWRDHSTPYIYRAVKNRAIDVVRKRRMVNRFFVPDLDLIRETVTDPDLHPHDLLQYSETLRAVDKALLDVPEVDREIFERSRRDGFTYAQIAAQLGLSVKRVERRMASVLAILRDTLSNFVD